MEEKYNSDSNIGSGSNYIIKLNENKYNRIGHDKIDEFKNMIFKELEQKTKIWDRHMSDIELINNEKKSISNFVNSNLTEFFYEIGVQ
jgi:hypothetical protein